MNKNSRGDIWRGLALLLVCLVGLPFLGGVGSVLYLRAQDSGALTRWRRLARPPEAAAEIAGGDLETVYVLSAAGQLYGCGHRRTDDALECWTPVAALPDLDEDLLLDAPVFEAQTPPPGPARDSLTVSVQYADAAYETRYALLEDGTVWKAELGSGAYLSLAQLCLGPVLGLIIGIVVVVVAALVWGGRALRRK